MSKLVSLDREDRFIVKLSIGYVIFESPGWGTGTNQTGTNQREAMRMRHRDAVLVASRLRGKVVELKRDPDASYVIKGVSKYVEKSNVVRGGYAINWVSAQCRAHRYDFDTANRAIRVINAWTPHQVRRVRLRLKKKST